MIDTHQHLLYPDRFSYDWTVSLPMLQGAFTLDAYRQAAAGCGIEGSLFMEVDVPEHQSAAEAQFFCAMADAAGSGIRGVIAAARPEAADFEQQLDAIAHPQLKGLRRVLHTQPDALAQSARFRGHVARLAGRALSFDICVLQRQLPLALELARAAPATVMILDHCGVPDIAANDAPRGAGWQQWRDAIRALAGCSNLNIKLSGLTAYAAPHQQTAAALQPYVDVVVESFGVDRIVWGGDWPVCLLGSGLARWCALSRELLAGLDAAESDKILVSNARHIYRI
jgi:predicted TIM-barrel fold metal-dependent hydrolase